MPLKFSALCLLLACVPLLAAPVGFRMDGTNRYPTATPQTAWSTTERVVWATELPKWSNASPVLVGDRIFVTTEPNTLLCLDRAGKILWQRTNDYDNMLTPEEKVKLAEERQAAAVQEKKGAEIRKALKDKRTQLTKAEDDAKANPNDATLPEKVTALKDEIKTLETQANEVKTALNALTLERQAAAVQEKKGAEIRKALRDKHTQLTKAEDDAKANPNDATLPEKVTALKDEIKTLETQANEVKTALNALTLAAKWSVPITHETNGYASDTPVSDGTYVYASFGNGVVACYTLDGACRWMRLIEKPTHGWGHSCSPVLVGDMVVIQFIDLFALDAKTGEERWRTKHPHIWGTPVVTRVGQLDVLVSDCGEVINAADGKTVAATGMRLEYGSPTLHGDVVYFASGKKAAAFRLAAGEGGTVTSTKLWEATVNNDRYYASPLIHDGLVYVVNQKGTLSVLDAAAGTLAYEQPLKLGGTVFPSPILAGSVIILSSDSGKSVVLTPGREYKEIARPTFERFLSTPVCDGARMYIRTSTQNTSKLYCIGE
ncbi:MAG: PQQ-binding-like beta-propeller repeat protein [Armatimonadota bacterium]